MLTIYNNIFVRLHLLYFEKKKKKQQQEYTRATTKCRNNFTTLSN